MSTKRRSFGLKSIMPWMLMVTFMTFLGSSCKVWHSMSASKPSTLTDKELSDCEYAGLRFLVLVAPDADFQSDVQQVNRLFGKEADAPIALMGKKYAAPNPIGCERYKVKKEGRYGARLLTLTAATKERLTAELAGIAAEIQEYRTANLKPDPRKQEVQVIFAYSGHGTNFGKKIAEGGLQLADGVLTFSELMQLFDRYLLSDCEDQACKTLRTQRADELLILNDSCFSGLMNVQLASFLENDKVGYGQQDKERSPKSLATRLFAITSTGPEMTSLAVASGAGYDVSLFSILRQMVETWSADQDKDGRLSLFEVQRYLDETAFNRFGDFVESRVKAELGRVICKAEPSAIDGAVQSLSRFSGFYAELFLNPIATMVSGNRNNLVEGPKAPALAPSTFAIQAPTFYTNIADTDIPFYSIAVNAKGTAAQGAAAGEFRRLVDRQYRQGLETRLKTLVLLFQEFQKSLDKPKAGTPPPKAGAPEPKVGSRDSVEPIDPDGELALGLVDSKVSVSEGEADGKPRFGTKPLSDSVFCKQF